MGSLKKMIVTKLFLLFNLILIVYPMTGGSTGSEDRIILHIHQDNPEDTGAAINEAEAAGDDSSSWTQSWTEDPSEPKPTWTDRPSWTKRPKWKTKRPEWTTKPSYPKRQECGRYGRCEDCKYADCKSSENCAWDYPGLCRRKECGKYGRCEDCKRADCESSENCMWDYPGLCRRKECGSLDRPCEKCGHTECEKSGYCYLDYRLGVCKTKEGCGWDCSKCKYKYACERDHYCRWNKLGKGGPKCEIPVPKNPFPRGN